MQNDLKLAPQCIAKTILIHHVCHWIMSWVKNPSLQMSNKLPVRNSDLNHVVAMLTPQRIKCFVFPGLTPFSAFSPRGLVGKSFVSKQNGGALKRSLCEINMVATGQEMVREKKFFKVREMSGNFILHHGKLAF